MYMYVYVYMRGFLEDQKRKEVLNQDGIDHAHNFEVSNPSLVGGFNPSEKY